MTRIFVEFKRYQLDIITIQEIRWHVELNLKIGNWTVFCNGSTRHQLDVGFIVNDIYQLELK